VRRIHLKLYASLSDYLPPDAVDHAVELELPDDATPAQVIAAHQLPSRLTHLVLLNGIYLYPQQRDRTTFHDGDTLAIWPPVAGG